MSLMEYVIKKLGIKAVYQKIPIRKKERGRNEN